MRVKPLDKEGNGNDKLPSCENPEETQSRSSIKAKPGLGDKIDNLDAKYGKPNSFKEETQIDEVTIAGTPGWEKSKGTVVDKSGAKHSDLSRVKHLAKLGMKKVNEEGMGDPGLIDTNAKLTLAKKKTNIVKTAAKNAKEKNSGKFNPDPVLSSPVAKQNDSV